MRWRKYYPQTVERSPIVLSDWNRRYYSTDSKELQKNGKISEGYDKLNWDFEDNCILRPQMSNLCSLFSGCVL